LQNLGVKEVRVIALTPQLTYKSEIKATYVDSGIQIHPEKAQSIWILVEGREP